MGVEGVRGWLKPPSASRLTPFHPVGQVVVKGILDNRDLGEPLAHEGDHLQGPVVSACWEGSLEKGVALLVLLYPRALCSYALLSPHGLACFLPCSRALPHVDG